MRTPQHWWAQPLPQVSIRAQLALLVGGDEQRPVTGGLHYPGSVWLRTNRIELGVGEPAAPGTGAQSVRMDVEGWSADLEYSLRPQSPRWQLAVAVGRPAGDDRPLRNLELEFELSLPGAADWILNAPGNRLLPDTRLAELHRPAQVATAGGNLGSPGIVALSAPDGSGSIVLWPLSRTEIGNVVLTRTADGLSIAVTTDLAGDPGAGPGLRYDGLYLDVLDGPWRQAREQLRAWSQDLDVASPLSPPVWAAGAAIYEVQPGRSVFSAGFSYEPYPSLADITADLPRIAGLGFTAVQLMPRHPYPSYNVHDYADVETSYGSPVELLALVRACHELGLRLILDVVLHGVIDRRAVETAVEAVAASGELETPGEPAPDVFAGSPRGWNALRRAWCQHVHDFAPYWLAGAVPVHPLVEHHPEWFCRDSAGQITGIYTEAFDLLDPSWQDYFAQAALELVHRFDIDGFRFDAPTYNNFANWSPHRRHHASASTMGSVSLFEHLRRRLKEHDQSLLMFTEPSGALHRRSMDVNYNYDELWLIPAVLAPEPDGPPSATGADVARWMQDRNAVLPATALTAHHVDSHDTFWWPPPGRKWRREQYGLAPTRAWTWVMALCGGPFLMFTGGEQGFAEELRHVLTLRQERRELGDGSARFDAVSTDCPEVFALVRQHGRAASLVLVNLSEQAVTAVCELAGDLSVRRYADYANSTREVSAAGPGRLRVGLGGYELALIELEVSVSSPTLRSGEPA